MAVLVYRSGDAAAAVAGGSDEETSLGLCYPMTSALRVAPPGVTESSILAPRYANILGVADLS
jgi:hypothetical protein